MENSKEPIRVAQIMGKWLGGGVESVVMNYYRHIDRTKIQFDFICDNDSTNIPYGEIESMGGRVILIPPYQKVVQYQKQLRNVLKSGCYGIVHSHINTLSIFSIFAAKCANVPIRIAHSHSTTNKKEKKKNLMKQVLKPFSKLYATDYMCCSELAGRWLFGDKVYDEGKVYLLNNAIDLDKFKYDEQVRTEVRTELNISKNTLVIGHIGRFVEKKNHSFLIDIFNEVYKMNDNSILLLAGQGPKMKEIKDKVRLYNLQNNVIFLGQRNDINRFYQAFDVFLLPSLYEGLGMVLIEAQCAGCYCIASCEVPNIAKITKNLEFIKLKESPKLWAFSIIKSWDIDKRKDYSKEVCECGYDVNREVKKLERKYFELYKNKK